MTGTIIFLGFVSLILSGIGLILIFSAQKAKKKSAASQSWPSVKGNVLSAEVHQTKIRDPRTGRKTISQFTPRITFSYSVIGKPYQSSRYSISTKSMAHKKVAEIVDGYKPGDNVDVYYNPEDPAEGVLLQAESSSVTNTVVGVFLILLNIAIVLLFLLAG